MLRTEFSQGDLHLHMLAVLCITNASLIFPISAKCTAQYKRLLTCICPVKSCRLNPCFYIFPLLPLNLKWSIYPVTESCHQLKSWSCSPAPAALNCWEQDSAEVGEDSSKGFLLQKLNCCTQFVSSLCWNADKVFYRITPCGLCVRCFSIGLYCGV